MKPEIFDEFSQAIALARIDRKLKGYLLENCKTAKMVLPTAPLSQSTYGIMKWNLLQARSVFNGDGELIKGVISEAVLPMRMRFGASMDDIGLF